MSGEAAHGALAQREGSAVCERPAELSCRPTHLRAERPVGPHDLRAGQHPFELDTVAARWQRALDAAGRALRAATGSGFPDAELSERARQLTRERHDMAEALGRLAALTGTRPAPWLSPVPVTPEMIGLPTTVQACLFDLDGVLTNSDVLHASAWAEVFDDLLLRQAETTGWHFRPFERDTDYQAYLAGRPRLEGIQAFLESRGLRLPEGRREGPRDADTAHALWIRKGEALERVLRSHRVVALPYVRRYLEAAGQAGLLRVVVSASASTQSILEAARLATLVEARVDAEFMRIQALRSRPSPDVLLAACRGVGIVPEHAVTFTMSPAGIAAGRAAGVTVVGIGEGDRAETLRGFGAERVVPSLGVLLDRRLVGGRP